MQKECSKTELSLEDTVTRGKRKRRGGTASKHEGNRRKRGTDGKVQGNSYDTEKAPTERIRRVRVKGGW